LELKTFDVDGAAITGVGVETNSQETSIRFPYGIRILRLVQATGTAAANDANWNLWAGYKDTGMTFPKAALLPTNNGGIDLKPSGVTIGPNVPIQWKWTQAVAQANKLEMYYERA